MQVREPVKAVDSEPTSLRLLVLSVIFRSSVSHSNPKSVWQDYDDYRGDNHNPNEVVLKGRDGGVDIDELLHKDCCGLKLATQEDLLKIGWRRRDC